MPPPNELRVFISSTFRDLQEEREHLVKKIFPEIRALCRERGIMFTEVDLRWGLTEEDVALGQVIRTCLEEIDKCRPYFIGITGERYGYVPELTEYYKDAELLKRYPWIQTAAMEGASIIDLEIRHAVLSEPRSNRDEPDGASFFFRRHRRGHECDVDELESSRLEALKGRIRATGVPVEDFRDPVSLGEMVYDALMEIIERDFAESKPPTPLEEERSRHRAFAESRRHAYIPNSGYLKRLDDWFAGEDSTPLVIYAESGSGKSSLVSFWCELQRSLRPELPIVEHYVGIGAGSSDHLAIMRHVMEEIQERFERADAVPSKPEQIEREFANWLGFAVGKPLVIVIDGINQLTGRALDLRWLPPVMPPGVKLIITSTVEQTLVDLRGRGWQTLGMQPLTEKEREAVVVRYLSEYHKALSSEQVGRLAADAKCAHPLFLRTLLEELRIDSSHEQLESRIERYLRTTGTEDLFQQVLERMEDDYSTRSVREVMSLIWCSRQGLDETDLADITGIGRLKLSTMLSGLDYHLVRKDGVLTFFHDYLRRAVGKRYLSSSDAQQEFWRRLAQYFEGMTIDARTALELLGALEHLGDREALERALAQIDRFAALWASDSEEVLRLWSSVDVDRVVAAYGSSLDQWDAGADQERELKVMGMLSRLYDGIGGWMAAERLERRRLDAARRLGNRTVESSALVVLSRASLQLGRSEEAVLYAREAESISRDLDDRRGIEFALSNLGAVRFHRGEYAEAVACFDECGSISRELGDRNGVARAVGNRAIMLHQRGEHSDALACYLEQESIVRELGNRRSLSVSLGNRGILHADRGEYVEALACYAEQESIARDLGDRKGMSLAIGNRGTVHFDRGEYAEALACYDEKESIARELGDRRGVALAIGNRGAVLASRGMHAEALECFGLAAEEHREMGDRSGLCVWLHGIAGVLVDVVEGDVDPTSAIPPFLRSFVRDAESSSWRAAALGVARGYAEQCVSICEELSQFDTLFAGRVLLTRVIAAEGDAQGAMTALRGLVGERGDDAQRAELHYRLWKLSATDADHRLEAEQLYAALFERIPKHDYRVKLEELRAAKPTPSPEADDAAAE